MNRTISFITKMMFAAVTVIMAACSSDDNATQALTVQVKVSMPEGFKSDILYTGHTVTMGKYTAITNEKVSLKSQRKNPKDNVPSKAPITWLMAGRLTKELGNIGGISFYANNILFYEPFLKNSTSNTLVQRNTGNFSFGVELFFNL